MNRVIDVKLINPYNNCILGNIIFLQYLSISIGLVDQMGACFDRLRYEVFQNLFWSSMNTGFIRPAVATVLTVYGIETSWRSPRSCIISHVATVLTVYGIETIHNSILHNIYIHELQQYLPFTVLKRRASHTIAFRYCWVATVLTVYGIETYICISTQCILLRCNSTYRLRYWNGYTAVKFDHVASLECCNSTYRLRYWN